MGEEKSQAIVEKATVALSAPEPMSTTEAVAVLELIAAEGDIVGVAARFARLRGIFRWR